MRICATEEKMGDPGERSFTQHGEANVIKLTKIYNNDKIPGNFCELGKRTK
jgi:hypothetical protein